MEIAQADTKALRLIGKLVLLGLLVVLLAKVFLVLLALALVGLLTFLVARAVYHRRRSFRHVAFCTKERLVHSVRAAGQVGSLARLAARSTCCAFLRLAGAFTALVCLLVYCVVKIGWKFARSTARVSISALLGLLWGVKTFVVGSGEAARTAAAKISNQSGVIFATFVEVSSGALIGAMLGFIPSFLPHEHALEARVWGAALFGAFLGVLVALSRTTWPQQEELRPPA
jgi:hypothetical protein